MIDPMYNSIKGKNQTKAEMALWTPARWMDFLRFIDFHIEKVKRSNYAELKDMYNITEDRILQLKEFSQQSDHPWLEFIARCGDLDIAKLRFKIPSLCIQAMKFLEIRPALVTNDMRLLMNKNPNLMGKYLRISPIIEAPPGVLPAIVPTINSKQIENLSEAMDIVQLLVRKIKKEGIDDMSVKDMISALPKIVDAINKMQGKATKIGNLTLINTRGSVEDMENEMLSMVGNKE
jgi:hypothetical protein